PPAVITNGKPHTTHEDNDLRLEYWAVRTFRTKVVAACCANYGVLLALVSDGKSYDQIASANEVVTGWRPTRAGVLPKLEHVRRARLTVREGRPARGSPG